MNYTSIAALHASHNCIQPLFLAMPINLGGLGLPPRQVGYILGTYGIMTSISQTFLLGRLVRKFGVKTVFVAAIAAFVPMFTVYPLMNTLVRGGGFSYFLWTILGLQLSCSLVMELGYGALSHTSKSLQLLNFGLCSGCVYMFITAAAPNKRSLGATNGLAQTLVSIGRIVTPVVASSLLSISIQYHIFGGYAAYLALVFLSFGGIWLAYQLPCRLESQ
jgi:MFS family permease